MTVNRVGLVVLEASLLFAQERPYRRTSWCFSFGDRETGSLIPTFRTLIGFKNTLLCFVGNSDQKRPFGQHNLREQWAGRAEFVGIPCNFP
jgi:hypothetical protein